MKSAHVDKYFILYLDGELTAGQRLVLEAHVRDCEVCRAGLEQMRFIYQPAVQISRLPLPPFAWTHLQPFLKDSQLRPSMRSGGVLPLLRPMAMAAMLLLAVLFGYYLGNVPAATSTPPTALGLEQALSLDIFSANPPLSLGEAMLTAYGQSDGRAR